MKNINNIVRNFFRPLALTVTGLALLAQASQAANIKFEARVPGYTQRGNGWALVLPGSGMGGRVQWSDARGCYVTDRVSRGEKIRISISPSTSTERCRQVALAGAYSDTGLLSWLYVGLPFVTTGTVPTNPSQDNVYVWTSTSSGYFDKRIPIGSR